MHDSIYMTFWRRQNCRNRNQIKMVAMDWELGESSDLNRHETIFCNDGNVLLLNDGDG